MFKITFLPARFGDSILVEYGEAEAPRRVLVDGGTRGTRADISRALKPLAAGRRPLELLVVTHVDRDHIEGVLGLLSEASELTVGEVWFNGWPHLPDNHEDEIFGSVQGERLTAQIVRLRLPWNERFGGKAVVVPTGGELPVQTLDGGLRLTVLSPGRGALARLKPVWEAELRKANLDPGFGLEPNDEEEEEREEEELGAEELPDIAALAGSEFEDDRSEANGSSIALLAEFDGKRALLAADAPAGALRAALDRLSPGRRVPLDLFKISHHGSRNTTSRELIEKVECRTYVFSTNGSIFKHPHAEAVSRVIVGGGNRPKLIFNYRSKRNELWDLRLLKERYRYQTRYAAASGGIEVEL